MIILVNFQTFQAMYMHGKVFVKETDTSWEMWTTENLFHIKCVVPKSKRQEENITFVERYFSDRQNIIKVIDIVDLDINKPVPIESGEAIRDNEIDTNEIDSNEIDSNGDTI